MSTGEHRADLGRRQQTAALSNGHLVRYTVTVLVNMVAEWVLFLGVLVYAFNMGGASATGLASIALLMPNIFIAPLAAAAAERYPPQRVRLAAMVIQTIAWATTAFAAYAELATIGVVIPSMIGLSATTALGPAGAVLRPAIVRSSRELTVANLWMTYCDATSVLAGPLVATAALGIGGASAALGASAILSALGALVTLVRSPIDPPGGSADDDAAGAFTLMRRALNDVRSRPGLIGVMAVAGGQFFVVGALDVAIVVAAESELDLGDSGPGILTTMFGAGAILAIVAATLLVKRPRLAPILAVAIIVTGGAAAAMGASLSVIAALVCLPIIGLGQTVLGSLSQLLLQRSSDPQTLGSVFAVLELAAGAGLMLGSIATQLLINLSGVRAAFIGVAVFLVLLLAGTVRSLRVADDSADVPVVAMSLLRGVPLFSPLPRAALESVARSSAEVSVAAGETLIRQGDVGERFYAVSDGAFTVDIDGRSVDTVRRGGSFGELALLAQAPRAATVTAQTDGTLLAIERTPFLIAVTGHDSARQAAWGVMKHHHGDETPVAGPDDFASPSPTHDDGDTSHR